MPQSLHRRADRICLYSTPPTPGVRNMPVRYGCECPITCPSSLRVDRGPWAGMRVRERARLPSSGSVALSTTLQTTCAQLLARLSGHSCSHTFRSGKLALMSGCQQRQAAESVPVETSRTGTTIDAARVGSSPGVSSYISPIPVILIIVDWAICMSSSTPCLPGRKSNQFVFPRPLASKEFIRAGNGHNS